MSIPNNITREHLLLAIKKIDAEGIPANAHSSTYDVVFQSKRYPPKLVVSWANIFANNFELDRSTFEGGLGTSCFNLLEIEGLTINNKEKKTRKNIMEEFRDYMYTIHQNRTTSDDYMKMMPRIEDWLINNRVVGNEFKIWNDVNLIDSINEKLSTTFKLKWKELNRNKSNWYSSPWNLWTKFNNMDIT